MDLVGLGPSHFGLQARGNTQAGRQASGSVIAIEE